MGKATRWLRALLGMKREKNSGNSNSPAGETKEKNRWSFSKSGKEFAGKVTPPPPRTAVADADWQRSCPVESEEEDNKHAIAVAAASAAAADAAVVAAQAAAAVVRLTNQGRGALFNGGKEILAAVKIQNVFRGHLARKALRALKGLVKLQALVRGFLVRKRTAETLQSMQALIRAQATVRSQRARRSHNKENKLIPEFNPKRFLADEIEDPKIVEIDTFKPKSRSRRFNSLLSELADERPSPYFWTMASPARFSTPRERHVKDFDWNLIGGGEECGRLSTATAQSTPRVGWAAVATPARSVYGEEGYFRPYGNYPNYMSSTQSFKAKLRSRSAPKQRPEVWARKRVALNELIGPRNSICSVGIQRNFNNRLGDQGEGGFKNCESFLAEGERLF